MKTKICFILIATIFLLSTACEKEYYDPGYFDGPSLSLSVATGGFGVNRDIVFDIIVNNGDNINQITVTNLGGTNPIVPIPTSGATTTPIPSQSPVTLPVTLDPATGKRIATFNKTKAELGLDANATAKVILKASATVDGKEIFSILTVTLAGTVAAPVNNYLLRYDGNSNTGGNVPMDLLFYAATGTVTVKANTLGLVKSGAKFVGWNTQADGLGTNYAPRRTFAMGAADRVLYAQWSNEATYSVTYNGNGNTNGNVPFDSNIYVEGTTVPVMSNIYSLEKTGFVFDGWNTQADGEGTTYAVNSQTMVMPANNVTLYAKWKK